MMKYSCYNFLFLLLLLSAELKAQNTPPVRAAEKTDTTTKSLKEVSITGRKKSFEVRNGKMIFNTGQQVTLAGSSVLEVLQRAPGVTIDQNESILLKGSSAVNVMIDGKMTYLSAQQLTNMLKGMNAATISRVEIISTPGAQFDAAGNAGVINIVTKKSSGKGYAADISSSVGSGHYLLTRHNLTGNIRNDWFNLFGTLDYNLQHSLSRKSSTQSRQQNSGNVVYDRLTLDEMNTNYYTYRIGADLTLNPRNELGLLYNGYTDDWSRNAPGKTRVSIGGSQSSVIENRTVLKEPYYNDGFNVSHRFKIDTAGKQLSTNADYISYRNHSDGSLSNSWRDLSGALLEPRQQLKFHQPSKIDIRSAKTDLELPYETVTVKSGLKYSRVSINNDFRYDSLVNNSFVYVPSLSDHFIYKENIAAAYLSIFKKWQQTSLDIGLRVENTRSDANSISAGLQKIRRYTDIFPSVSIDQHLGSSGKLNISLSRRINRPVYTNLNPVRYYTDKHAYFQGNPELLPEKGWTASVLYALKDTYSATLTYSRANNFIGQTAMLDAASGILVTSNGNFSQKDRYDLLLAGPVSISSFWNANNTVNLSYTSYPLQQIGGTRTVNKTAVDLSSAHTLSLPGKAILELSAKYTSPTLNGVYVYRYYFTVDGGLKKAFFNNKLDFRFSATDVFRTVRLHGYSISNAAITSYSTKPDTRRVNFLLTYHIGGKLKSGRNQRLEEKDRL